jgi:predicted hydrolase (HD superfamily)
MNRFKEKSFARGADRNQIQSCKNLQLSLNEFLLIALQAMQKISPQLGL